MRSTSLLCVSLLSAVFFSLLITFLSDAVRVNATLDPCNAVEDCRVGLLCVSQSSFLCSNDPLFAKQSDCRCLPSEAIKCNSSSSSSQCPPAEGCATSKLSNNTFCVSCNRILEPQTNYTPIDDTVCRSSPTPLPTPSSSPGPLRQLYDLCSETHLCANPFTCADLNGRYCDERRPPCYCVYSKRSKAACSNPSQCIHSTETCVIYTRDNSTTCASCTLLKTDPRYIPFVNDHKCDTVPIKPPADYNAPYGLAYDLCYNGRECTPPYRCMKNANKRCTKDEIFCSCFSNQTASQCNNYSDCQPGEICVTSRTASATCVSFTEYFSKTLGVYNVVGQIPPRGQRISYESCKNTFECSQGLFCSHQSENIVGTCFGRNGCVCTPLHPIQCKSAFDCRPKEACVKYPDSREEPFCYSKAVAKLDPYVIPVNMPSWPRTILPTDGWSGDSCKSNDDCNQDVPRICQHYTETKGLCNGRQTCVCKPISSQACTTSATCGSGELCAVFVMARKKVEPKCISKKVLELEINEDVYVEAIGPKKRRSIHH